MSQSGETRTEARGTAAWERTPAATETPLTEAFYPIPEAICLKGIPSLPSAPQYTP